MIRRKHDWMSIGNNDNDNDNNNNNNNNDEDFELRKRNLEASASHHADAEALLAEGLSRGRAGQDAFNFGTFWHHFQHQVQVQVQVQVQQVHPGSFRHMSTSFFVPRMREASQEIKDWKTVRLPASNLKNCPHVEPARRVQPASMAGAASKPCECPCSRGRPADNTPNAYGQSAIQDLGIFGPNPWQILRRYLSTKGFWAT